MMLCEMRLHPSQETLVLTLCASKPTILPPPTFQSSRQQVDIVLSIDGIRMLANVIIVHPIWVDLVSCTTLFRGVVTTMATKEGL